MDRLDDPADSPTRTRESDGPKLGVYQVHERLGAGGMGEVFRGIDTRLGRRVAIKMCAGHFSERFEREARAISALNHPHICTLYDVGPDYLVMELIDGDTLSARIARGAQPMADVYRYGAEIADALAEAHAAGIVHRDLKPGNVMITRHGVKVLDFGLAKMADSGPLVTQPFAVMGTPAYMAPEQCDGRDVDARTDLFALGLVLYEMATGRLPLPGASLGSALLTSAPVVTPPSQLRADVPPAFDDLVMRLLSADLARRPANAADVASALRALTGPRTARGNLIALFGVLAAGLVIMAIAITVLWRRTDDAPLQVARLSAISTARGAKLDLAYSPDGSMLAYFWPGDTGDAPGLYVIRGQEPPRRITSSTSVDASPAWSPDGRQIAFLRTHPGLANELMVVDVSGGEPRDAVRVRELRQPDLLIRTCRPALTWTPDGRGIVTPMADPDSGLASLFRVPLDGSAPERLVASHGGQGASSPAFSADGKWLAFTDSDPDGRRLYIAPVATTGVIGQPQRVPGGAFANTPSLSPDGKRVLWTSGERLFEWTRASERERQIYVMNNDQFQSFAVAWPSVGPPRGAFSNLGRRIELRQLPIEDGGHRGGTPTELVVTARSPANPAFSPDGRWLVFVTTSIGGALELSIATADGEGLRTLAPIYAAAPIVWSADSRHLTFGSRPPALAQAVVLDIDERGTASAPRQVTKAPFEVFAPAFSPDGQWLYATSTRDPTLHRVVRVPTGGGALEDLFEGDSARLSTDGRSILYAKPTQRGLWQRSLDGDVAANRETRVIEDYVGPVGFIPWTSGVFYVGRSPTGEMTGIRFFEYASRRSFDLAPAAQVRGGLSVPVLALSADGRRLVYSTAIQLAPTLTAVEFR